MLVGLHREITAVAVFLENIKQTTARMHVFFAPPGNFHNLSICPQTDVAIVRQVLIRRTTGHIVFCVFQARIRHRAIPSVVHVHQTQTLQDLVVVRLETVCAIMAGRDRTVLALRVSLESTSR